MNNSKKFFFLLFLLSIAIVLSGCGKKVDISEVGEYDPDEYLINEQDPNDEDFEFADVSKDESQEIATAYILSLEEFTERDARDFEFEDSEKTICDSCYNFTFTFEADTDKDEFKEEKVTMVVKVQGGVVVGHSSTAEGTVERPPEELCVDVLECENGSTFPIEQWNEKDEICERIVYLGGNPCYVSNYTPLVIETDEHKNCVEQGYLLDQTPSGDYLCLFPDKSYCEVGLLLEGECFMGECYKECKVGDRGEGIYSSCTGNLIQLQSCEE